jgi:hypothetical protein
MKVKTSVRAGGGARRAGTPNRGGCNTSQHGSRTSGANQPGFFFAPHEPVCRHFPRMSEGRKASL